MLIIHSVATNYTGFDISDQAQSSMTTRYPFMNILYRISSCSR